MIDEQRLIEMLKSGASLAECANEFGVSRNAISKRKKRLVTDGRLAGCEPDPIDEAQERFTQIAVGLDRLRQCLADSPRLIDDAKRELIETTIQYFLGEAKREDVETVTQRVDTLRQAFEAAELARPRMERLREDAQRAAQRARREQIEAAQRQEFAAMKIRLLERAIPLTGGEERELRRLAVGNLRYEVDRLVQELEEQATRRMYATGHYLPRG